MSIVLRFFLRFFENPAFPSDPAEGKAVVYVIRFE
jgi:hypothetical protein